MLQTARTNKNPQKHKNKTKNIYKQIRDFSYFIMVQDRLDVVQFVDEDDFPLDDEGNVVDANGDVLYTLNASGEYFDANGSSTGLRYDEDSGKLFRMVKASDPSVQAEVERDAQQIAQEKAAEAASASAQGSAGGAAETQDAPAPAEGGAGALLRCTWLCCSEL